MLSIGFFLMLLALGISAITFSSWSGAWRVLGMLAPFSVIGIVLKIVIGIAIDPSSNNLWPFDIVVVSGLASIYLVLLWLLKYVFTRESQRGKANRKKFSEEDMPFAKLMSKARGDTRRPRK